MKILIVDDSKAMRMIVRKTLRQAGYGDHEVEEAVDGADALAKIQTSTPDLVISDWNMPQMSGIQLLQALRQGGNGVAFGFVTSESSGEMRQLASDSGALFLISKPFTADTFQQHLGTILAA